MQLNQSTTVHVCAVAAAAVPTVCAAHNFAAVAAETAAVHTNMTTPGADREYSYAAIRRGGGFNWMFVCFAVFILACGATHVMEVWVIWQLSEIRCPDPLGAADPASARRVEIEFPPA
jgi:hypothetical protein